MLRNAGNLQKAVKHALALESCRNTTGIAKLKETVLYGYG